MINCAGTYVLSIILFFPAVAICAVAALEFLRRKRTEDKNDDWGQ